MARSFLPNLFSIFLLSFPFGQSNAQQAESLPPVRSEPGMKAELETVYLNWSNALTGQNLKAWEEATAMYRQMETRNRIISEKESYPEALFDSPMQPPSLATLMHLGIFTRRDTASSIYYGKADFGVSDPIEVTTTLLVLRYLKEDGKWRFDNSRIVRIGNDTAILHQIRSRDYSFLNADEFQPLSYIPEIQQPVQTPELMAEAWVTSIGYKTEFWINGHKQGVVENNGGKDLVMGGIKKQGNVILIKTQKIPCGNHQPRFEFGIYAADEPGKPANRVFHFSPKNAIPESFETGFSGRLRQVVE